MKQPRPGKPVRGSKTGKPVMALLDLIGRRHSLRILWELRGGARTLSELVSATQSRPGVLKNRLDELCAARILALTAVGYNLTRDGRALLRQTTELTRWAEGWAARLEKPAREPKRRR